MKKKTNDSRSEKAQPSSRQIDELKSLLKWGEYLGARRLARHILNEKSFPHDDQLAKQALRQTWPDPLALLAGAIVLVVSIVVAFLVAY